MKPDENLCPIATKETIDLYISHGCECGSFTTCVLENDLFGAMWRMDSIDLAALPHTCAYIYNCIPVQSWGSPAKVRDWKTKKRWEGSK